jgi:DNA-binding MarR family transcriptional regulator
MSRLVSLSLIAFLAAPAVAGAQYRNVRNSRDGALVIPRVAPAVAALAVRYGGDLQLSQVQLDSIMAVRQRQDSANAPWLRTLDSLRNGPHPVNPLDLSQEQREMLAKQRATLATALDAMRATNEAARRQVMAVLTPDQQRKAAQLESDAQELARAETERRADQGYYGRRGTYDQLVLLPED